MFPAIKGMMLKDLKTSFRNPSMLILSIIVPIVFIFLYSLISQLSTTNPIVIAQHSDDPASNALTTIMEEMEIEDGPYYEIRTLDPDEAFHMYQNGEAPALVEIPEDFDQQLQQSEPPNVKLYVHNMNSDATKNFQLRLSHALHQFQENEDSEHLIDIHEASSTFETDISMKLYVSIGLLMFAVIYSGMVNTATLLTREWEERTSKEISLSPNGFAPLLIAKAFTAFLLTTVTTILVMILMAFTLNFPIENVSLAVIGWLVILFLIGASLGAFTGVTIKKSLPVITLSAVIGISLYLLCGNESSIRGFAYGGPIAFVWRLSSYLPMSYITDTIRFIFVTGKNHILTSASNPLTTTTSFYTSMITIPTMILLLSWDSIVKLKNNLFASSGQ
ncbi:ABC transporter permease [Virgibacillus sp. NKC19-3]|uniref:ABC transporter permease n=1 Tax=Virgibacillus saliphilus TaxID=2831674 RepID=UPI001C9A8E2F|nr:ABC transporter permease [Virgibacillus sp. NKC19-3]MBY7142575.1 ABC transporter permease [Virgibacillus sp. NKC19-3]